MTSTTTPAPAQEQQPQQFNERLNRDIRVSDVGNVGPTHVEAVGVRTKGAQACMASAEYGSFAVGSSEADRNDVNLLSALLFELAAVDAVNSKPKAVRKALAYGLVGAGSTVGDLQKDADGARRWTAPYKGRDFQLVQVLDGGTKFLSADVAPDGKGGKQLVVEVNAINPDEGSKKVALSSDPSVFDKPVDYSRSSRSVLNALRSRTKDPAVHMVVELTPRTAEQVEKKKPAGIPARVGRAAVDQAAAASAPEAEATRNYLEKLSPDTYFVVDYPDGRQVNRYVAPAQDANGQINGSIIEQAWLDSNGDVVGDTHLSTLRGDNNLIFMGQLRSINTANEDRRRSGEQDQVSINHTDFVDRWMPFNTAGERIAVRGRDGGMVLSVLNPIAPGDSERTYTSYRYDQYGRLIQQTLQDGRPVNGLRLPVRQGMFLAEAFTVFKDYRDRNMPVDAADYARLHSAFTARRSTAPRQQPAPQTAQQPQPRVESGAPVDPAKLNREYFSVNFPGGRVHYWFGRLDADGGLQVLYRGDHDKIARAAKVSGEDLKRMIEQWRAYKANNGRGAFPA